MARGPKPTPKKLQALRGNPGKRKLNRANDPEFEGAIPEPPDFLEGEALEEWNRIVDEMDKMQLITTLDRTEIALYAWTFGEFARHSRLLRDETEFPKSKRGAPTVNPRIRVVRDLLKQLHSLSESCGFSPTTRNRLQMVHKPKENTPKQALAEKLFNAPVRNPKGQ